MSRKSSFLGVGAIIALLVLWWFALWSPRSADLQEAKNRQTAAEQQNELLAIQLQRLESLKENEPKLRLQVDQLQAAVPDNPNLAEFILDADDASRRSGIDFLSISPSPPVAGLEPEDPAQIAMSISINGGYFQVLDFINRLNDLSRLVVIDTLSLGAAAADGVVELQVAISARMFLTTVPLTADTADTADTDVPVTTTTTVAGAS